MAQEAMAQGSPFRFRRKARKDCPRNSGPEEVGVLDTRQGQDAVGGWPVQA